MKLYKLHDAKVLAIHGILQKAALQLAVAMATNTLLHDSQNAPTLKKMLSTFELQNLDIPPSLQARMTTAIVKAA